MINEKHNDIACQIFNKKFDSRSIYGYEHLIPVDTIIFSLDELETKISVLDTELKELGYAVGGYRAFPTNEIGKIMIGFISIIPILNN